jgi:hypothetical protein
MLLVAAVALNGLLAGMSIDQTLKQVPSRRRIGIRNYAIYARGADLGSGLMLYVVLPNLAVLITLAAGAAVWICGPHAPGLNTALAITVGLTVAHVGATFGAAPKMLRSRRVPLEDETSLAKLFDSFERWQLARAALQTMTFGCSIWTLIEAGDQWPVA